MFVGCCSSAVVAPIAAFRFEEMAQNETARGLNSRLAESTLNDDRQSGGAGTL